jgi:glycosyltransferase involved in cell wall biosynthesis
MYGETSRVDYPYEGELVYLDRSRHINLFVKIKLLFLRILKVKKLKKENPKGAVISFLEYPNLINLITPKHGKTIISVRNHMSTKHHTGIKAKIWNATIRYLYPKADLIIVVSEEIKKDLINNYYINPNKIKVIYNSYDIENIQRLAEEEMEDEYKNIFKKPVIITAGRLNKQKGQWHLIRAFAKVQETIPDAKLVILGEGELEQYLKNLSKDSGLEEDVHFLGFKENPFKYIANSKLFVMSSLYEGFPNALAEAMACGVPVISSDCLSGPREILAPSEYGKVDIDYKVNETRFGVLLPVCDGKKYEASDNITKEEQGMANAIIKLLKDSDMWNFFSSQSLKRIQDFEINNIIKEWESIIQ